MLDLSTPVNPNYLLLLTILLKKWIITIELVLRYYAFDKVAHSRLLYKLNYYGIRGSILGWLKSFLYDQTQQVIVEGSKSSICEVTSGVNKRQMSDTVCNSAVHRCANNRLLTGV